MSLHPFPSLVSHLPVSRSLPSELSTLGHSYVCHHVVACQCTALHVCSVLGRILQHHFLPNLGTEIPGPDIGIVKSPASPLGVEMSQDFLIPGRAVRMQFSVFLLDALHSGCW